MQRAGFAGKQSLVGYFLNLAELDGSGTQTALLNFLQKTAKKFKKTTFRPKIWQNKVPVRSTFLFKNATVPAFKSADWLKSVQKTVFWYKQIIKIYELVKNAVLFLERNGFQLRQG